MITTDYKTLETLESGLNYIKQSPSDYGLLSLIVSRPDVDQRKVLDGGLLDTSQGLVGDNWAVRGSSRTDDGSAHPDMQINIMNARAIEIIARDKNDWKLAGDQLFVDFDLTSDNLPVGTQISVGTAILEITSIPHNGCKKFAQRFGVDAMKFVNSREGKRLKLRGVNARVIQGGSIKTGDRISKVPGK